MTRVLVPFFAAGSAVSFSACNGRYSALDPAGAAAQDIAGLWWLMFTLFTLVFLAIVMLWLIALQRRSATMARDAARQAQRRWIVGGALVLPLACVVVILVFGVPAGHRMAALPADDGAVRIDITARQWEWIVHYPGTNITLRNEIVMPANTPVNFHLFASDVIHSFWVPRLGGKLDAIPGRENILRLQPRAAGVYHGLCSEYCGTGHAHMKFTVTAIEPQQYARWLQEAPSR